MKKKFSGSCISDDVIAANGTKTTGAQTPPENRLSSAIIYNTVFLCERLPTPSVYIYIIRHFNFLFQTFYKFHQIYRKI